MAGSIHIHDGMRVGQKIGQLDWGLIVLLAVVGCVGITALYSAAGGHLAPWAARQIVHFMLGGTAMLIIALTDIKWWHRLAYPLYAAGLVLLVVVWAFGTKGMGAQRWINIGFFQLQPSELMKIAVIMALARYFHAAGGRESRRILFLIPPALMILLPVGLVMLQPDLGTAMMITLGGAGMFFIGGAPIWLFIGGTAAAVAAAPVAWHFMHDYQRQRVRIFLHPESDPLGAGYHITQSKIALGSGGVNGRGFLHGTQSHLNFLPEKQTDFIFTLWCEEWGLIGGFVLMGLFALIMVYCGWIASRCRHDFGRLLAFGLMMNFSLYCFVNVAMVMGFIPVVGVPLPLVSYGGTAVLSILAGFGLIMSCHIHRDAKLPRM
ncbi:MAG TPA: rod shape-determining protein RodA [Patescibacteria group bacterium]|nr:rod shape-determining protein RodA [Patescibacteria group bacterium]